LTRRAVAGLATRRTADGFFPNDDVPRDNPPLIIRQDRSAWRLANDINLHLSVRAIWLDAERREQWSLEAIDPGWTKWTPSAPTSPHWYRIADLEPLAGAFLAHDRERKTVRVLRDFLTQFDGLSGTANGRRVKRCTRTLDRCEAKGLLIVRRSGSQKLVDVAATTDRLRGLDRPRRGKPRAT
jgi:hypothetical protein